MLSQKTVTTCIVVGVLCFAMIGGALLCRYAAGKMDSGEVSEDLQARCESGYFTYEPLQTEDYEKTIELIKPTLVNLMDGANEKGGSGYIYQITPEEVYFLSVSHVLEKVKEDCFITFFDGARVQTAFTYDSLEGENELSMFHMKTDCIPMDTLLKLKQISIDYDIYDKMASNQVLLYAAHFAGQEDEVIHIGELTDLNADLNQFGYTQDRYLETTQILEHGISGTALVDYRGNLLGTALGFSGEHAYYVKVDRIKELGCCNEYGK